MADNFNTLYLLSYNNYYNRLVKKLDTLQEYGEYIVDTQQNINFNPADGINTQQVVNSYNSSPDYLIVAKGEEIVSRWFIVEAERLRNGQYQLTLHRDTAVDYYDEILNAPVFIEKATLDSSDPMIYNSENMSYNQIKSREEKLYDKTNTSWIVGYLDQNSETKKYQILAQAEIGVLTNYEELAAHTAGNPNKMLKDAQFKFNAYDENRTSGKPSSNKYYEFTADTNGNASYIRKKWEQSLYYNIYFYTLPSDVNNATTQLGNIVKNSTSLKQAVAGSEYTLDDFYQYNGKLVKDTNDNYYRVTVSNQTRTATKHFGPNDNPLLYSTFTMVLENSWTYGHKTKSGNTSGDAYVTYVDQTVTLTPVKFDSFNVTTNQLRRLPEDAPYYAFAMPYTNYTLRLAIEMATKEGQHCYDIQVLPYCPVQDYYDEDGDLLIEDLTEHLDYEHIKQVQSQVETNVNYLFWIPKTSFTFNIDKTILNPTDNIEFKVSNECDFYRLCSPNGNGEFEFKSTKTGNIEYFNVDCTYRPINPYIHMNPNFGELYGSDYDDFRGLILQGDFSIPTISDAWVNYENNNKNYNNIFVRQIQNIEVQNKYQRINEIVGSGIGVGQGALAGGTTGAMLGGPAGAAIGAIGGGVLSAAGGVADFIINEKLRNETLDYTIDQFGYNLGNIRAMPQSISKTGCLTNNNKLVPYLEYYTCTEVEKQALRDKIKYNGMTVMRIGKIADYIKEEPTYIKGKLIRAEEISDDYHLIKSIAEELDKGVII